MVIMEITPPQNRTVFSKTFEGNGIEFSADREALAFCARHKFSVAPMDVTRIRGLMFGEWRIAKWYNLTPEERSQCHGTLTGCARTGSLIIRVYEHAPMTIISALAHDWMPFPETAS